MKKKINVTDKSGWLHCWFDNGKLVVIDMKDYPL